MTISFLALVSLHLSAVSYFHFCANLVNVSEYFASTLTIFICCPDQFQGEILSRTNIRNPFPNHVSIDKEKARQKRNELAASRCASCHTPRPSYRVNFCCLCGSMMTIKDSIGKVELGMYYDSYCISHFFFDLIMT